MGKPKRDTGNWLITYSDLVTLLLVFFVLLYTLTPGVRESTFNSFISYFQKSPGLFEDNAVSNDDASSNSAEEAENESVERWDAFADFLERHGLSSEVGILRVPDGVKITLSDSLTFESGSDELLPMAKLVLEEVAKILDNRIREVEVQGHTDNVPIADTSKFRSNWHLGSARSVSVVQFILNRSTVDPDRYKASSFGKYRPITTNDNEYGRRQNRRVEIYIRDESLVNRARIRNAGPI
jgi:chemotaxis protein MotB